MPVQRCVKNGRPGYRWGEQNTCYTYTPGDKASRERARKKAAKQGQAIKARQNE